MKTTTSLFERARLAPPVVLVCEGDAYRRPEPGRSRVEFQSAAGESLKLSGLRLCTYLSLQLIVLKLQVLDPHLQFLDVFHTSESIFPLLRLSAALQRDLCHPVKLPSRLPVASIDSDLKGAGGLKTL